MAGPGDRDPVASCEGKAAFADPRLAEQAGRRSRAKHQQAIAPYKCEHCHQWHLGKHNDGRIDNRAKRARKQDQGVDSWGTDRYR